MKRLSKLLLMGIVALGVGFTACNNEDVPDGPDTQKGNTHVSVALKLSSNNGAGTRALPNDYNDVGKWAGNDVVTNITVYLSDLSTVVDYNFEVGTDKAYVQEGSILRPTTAAAITTTAGIKEVYVLVNPSSEALGVLASKLGSAGEFKAAYENVVALANSGTSTPVSTSASKIAGVNGDGNDEIMMTTVEPQTINVAPNVTQKQTIDEAANRVSLEVERAVARVMVTKSRANNEADYTIPSADGGTEIGAVSNITWVLAQGENSLYVQRKVDWATPNYEWVPETQATFEAEAGDIYDYSGLFELYQAEPNYGGTAVPPLTTYTALNTAGNNQNDVLASLNLDLNAVNGKFILPNTHEYGEKEASSYKKGNTAYVLVRAKFVPNAWGDTGEPKDDGTFYLGKNGKFYTTAQAAYDDTKSTVITKYEGGKVLYYAWVNPDEIPAWYNSPVLRNNIYHIHITGFKTLGTNWNPLFPEDPTRKVDTDDPNYNPDDPETWTYKPKENPDPKPVPEIITVPDPENPDEKIEIPTEEPENPIDPTDPLTTPETWMSVDVTILPWLVHSYQVDLGI